jgi:predicted  nucleic acid-binding Zn-ribbon protein
VSVEWFLKLKEINSLTKMRQAQVKSKKEQEDRVSKLIYHRDEALTQTIKLKQELHETNEKLVETEHKIKLFSTQRQNLLDLGGDELKISQYESQIDSLEETGLGLLETIEESQSLIKDKKTFIAGVEKTILEIQEESLDEILKLDSEIKNIDLRLISLKDELPSEYQRILKKISEKNLAHGPFTRIEIGSCFFCRYKMSRIEESEIDMQKNLKICPQCSRIFLPYGA